MKSFEDFLSFARTSIEEIEDADKHEEFKSKLEAASNSITDQKFEYWTQNKNPCKLNLKWVQERLVTHHLLTVELIMRARVKNTIHRASVHFSVRSAGSIWFFYFLVNFSQVKSTLHKSECKCN